jgi:hypothetical protein
MRTTCRPTHATRVLTDRAAGAAGGQSRRGHGGPGERDRTVTVPGRLRRALVPGRPLRLRPGRGREAGKRGVARQAPGIRALCRLGIPFSYLTGPEQELTGMMCECCPVDTDPVLGSPHWRGFRGAGVFNAAAPRWGCATADRLERSLDARTARFVGVMTCTPLRGFATGRPEPRHPVHDNVRDLDYDLSPANAVSAS